MAVEDDIREGSASSHIFDSLEFNQREREDVLSPEDVAWADSCLIRDPDVSEISENNWNSLKDALLEILSSEPKSLGSSATGADYFSRGSDSNTLHSTKEAETAPSPERTTDDFFPMNEERVKMGNDGPVDEGTDTLQPQTSLKNPFLPNYKDKVPEIDNADQGLDFDFPAYEVEPSSENIFKVWDLGIPEEEVELLVQLKKALPENGFQSIPWTLDAPGAWKESNDEPVDNLIAGIADLSLN
ncbi:uncharacterized protein LOC131156440 isoform X2 [Malania oleifera]|nr:uncharacterized protein LOC131156440 isoform X2 [Malania oleifera]